MSELRCQRCNWTLEYSDRERILLMDVVQARLCPTCRTEYARMMHFHPLVREQGDVSMRLKMVFALTRADAVDRTDEAVKLQREIDDFYLKLLKVVEEWAAMRLPQPAPVTPPAPQAPAAPLPIPEQKPIPMCAPEVQATPSMRSEN